MIHQQKVQKGLGSVFGKKHDPVKELRKVSDGLKETNPAMEFLNSHGWDVIKKRYEKFIVQQNDVLLGLCRNADRNKSEIQKMSDFIDACQALLEITDDLLRENLAQHKKLTGTAE